jgi:hypothetical protein
MSASVQEDVSLETLENHAALAGRLVRSKPVLQIYFRWLSRAVSKFEPPQSPSAALKASLDALLNPLRNDSDRGIQRETESTSLWLGAICEYVAARSLSTGGSYLIRSLAASFLPLYRTLATGRLQEGLVQTKHRLGETLVLIGLSEALQLERLLELSVSPQVSPHQSLTVQLTINPSSLSYLICQVIDGYNQAKDEFDAKASSQLTEFRAGEPLPTSHQIPDWAHPQLLWVLSNELVSSRSEFVVPRSWIDTPVPWSKISEHWHDLERLLTSTLRVPGPNNKPADIKTVGSQSTAEPTGPAARDQAQSDRSDTTRPKFSTAAALEHATAIVQAAESGWEGLEAIDVIDRILEEDFGKRPQATDSKTAPDEVAKRPKEPLATVSKREITIVPKVLIGEITNHNDPAFANVIRRQVGICKQEDRSICLSMIMVTAQDQRENLSLTAPHDNGLSRWQQKLVNWICDHPELTQPSAFLTRDGQLILVVMDTERNAMTRILRQGLVEVLTGKSGPSGDLTRVAIPAHFHVGMSSTTSPSASFEFEELIASAHRCQSSAKRMGSASIKSIEVY